MLTFVSICRSPQIRTHLIRIIVNLLYHAAQAEEMDIPDNESGTIFVVIGRSKQHVWLLLHRSSSFGMYRGTMLLTHGCRQGLEAFTSL